MGAKEAAEKFAVYKTIDYLFDDPETRFPKIMDAIDKFAPSTVFPEQRDVIRRAYENHTNWYEFILRLTRLSPDYAKRMLKTLVVDANLLAWTKQEESREKYQCNIPWAILLDPTSACNLKCTGCWAADYGHSLHLSYETIDSIVEQGKALGTHIYIYTGGEPLVRKKDLIRICEKHQDCSFLCFTNATLIDEAFCQDMLRVANFVPAISVEGFREATDKRRGEGVFDRVSNAMRLMREHGLAFGTSCCFTSENASSIASEEFFDWQLEQGVLFTWIFTYMPIGQGAPTSLMASPEQREHLFHFVRGVRETKPLFAMDFWGDGEFVGGCIAGGRRYLHINAKGDVEPCVFAHYSSANIHDVSLLDALRQPLFMEYYHGQPFNDNLLRPCPMLDNKDRLAEMVERSGAKPTDLMGAEPAADLCAKCHEAIEGWAPVAQKLWDNPDDPAYAHRHDGTCGMSVSDMNKFKRDGRLFQGVQGKLSHGR
ncbi:MAG: radical SAM protein [Eggerthellaceae bacterium]|nr:radical SAM protein [Eggerthellaceae bacterium]